MARESDDLTKRYSSLFENRLRVPIVFVRDLHRSQKLPELASFLAWEVLHKLRLFGRDDYLEFNSGRPLVLGEKQVSDPLSGAYLAQLGALQGLRIAGSRHNWKLFFVGPSGQTIGCIYPEDSDLYESSDYASSLTHLKRLGGKIKAIFISSRGTIFVCIKGAVYRSSDGGVSFDKCLNLSSSESFFRHNNGMTEIPGKGLVIGEYGNVWDKTRYRTLAYFYLSSDDGETWTRSNFLIKEGINKHVHVVKYSRLLDRLLLADGDNKKKLWISAPRDTLDMEALELKAVNHHHIQIGGYTAIAECGEGVLFGTDYQGGTNFVVESRDGKIFRRRVVPDPYRRSPIDNMVCRKARRGYEVWANLPFSAGDSRCLLMYTADCGMTWNRVIEYKRATHTVWLLSSSSDPVDRVCFAVQDSGRRHRVVYEVSDNGESGVS